MRRISGSATRFAMAAGVVAILAAGPGLGSVLAAQDQQPAQVVPAEELLQRLAALEPQLSTLPLLPNVTVVHERTWGTIDGDFVTPKVVLDELDDDLQLLVADSSDTRARSTDEADAEIGRAVESVANSYRTLRSGYTFLAAYEQAGLLVGLPPAPGVTSTDETPELAGPGDEARAQAETGLQLLLEALAGLHDGYSVLRDTDEVTFGPRFDAVEAAARAEGADARKAMSLPAAHVLVAESRFEARFSDDDPARVVRYSCPDVDDYLARRAAEQAGTAIPEGADVSDLPLNDCPALANANAPQLIPAGTP